MKTLIVATLLLTASNAMADEYCKTIAEAARVTMEVRQAGAQMSAVYENASNALLQSLVMEAYQRPRYATDEYQRREVVDFENEIYLLCVKTYKPAKKSAKK